MKRFITTLILTAFFMHGAAQAAPAEMTREQVLKKIETYFNTVKTMKSEFVQSSSSGAFAQGDVVVSKPDKMRLTYRPPSPVEVIADGKYLIFHDKKLGQVTHMDLADNPAAFMLHENFKFDTSGLTVEDVSQGQGTVEITVYKTNEASNGRVKLIFRKNPFELKQWQVTDAQQVKTTVTLAGTQINGAVDDGLFVFKNPKKAARPGDKGYRRNR